MVKESVIANSPINNILSTMETERLIIRKKINNHNYRITIIVDGQAKYKIIAIYGGHNIPIPGALVQLMDERYDNLKQFSEKLRAVETKIDKRRHNG